MDEDIQKVYSDISDLAKRLNVNIVVGHDRLSPVPRLKQYVIRFTMKRRWGGEKKFAYQCTLGTLVQSAEQIERVGGKIVGID